MMFVNRVRKLLDNKITPQQAKEILEDVEKDVGHEKDLIEKIINEEGIMLVNRLYKKTKEKEKKKELLAYA